MRRPRETDTVKAILQFLALHKIPAWRVNTGAFRAEYKGETRFHRFGAVGMADIVGVWPLCANRDCRSRMNVCRITEHCHGLFLAIEVKSATGKVSPAQAAFLDTVNAAGGKGFVARSVADVQKELGL